MHTPLQARSTAPGLLLAALSLSGLVLLFSAGTARAVESEAECSHYSAAMNPEARQYVAPDRNFSTKHISLDLDLDVRGGTIRGNVTHTLEVLKPGATELRLNAVGLGIDAVSIDGQPVSFDYPVADWQETSPDSIWIAGATLGDSHDGLVVHTAAPLTRGQLITLRVDYHGAPQEGLYFQHEEPGPGGARPEVWSQGEGERNRYWIPCFDYPNEKATYDGTFRVDPDLTVLSNGRLDNESEVNGKKQFHWVLDQPQVTYLIMVAAAQYEVYSDTWRGKPVTYYVPPGTGEKMARDNFKQTPDMLEYFSNVLGIEYPYDKYGQVVVQNFIFGGMENTSATVLTARGLYDDSSLLNRDNEDLVAHELAHQWWGDMVTLREWNHMWLNEGFATFFQKLYKQHHKGDAEYIYDFAGAHQEVLNADGDPRPMVVDFFNRVDDRSSSNVYPKGATVLDMLRQYLGDEVFFDALHRYGERMKFQNADTQDLMRAFREASGENLDWFFEQWVYLAGHPDLKVSKSWDAGRGLLTLQVQQTQAQSNLVPLFRLPLDLRMDCAEGTQDFRIVVSKADEQFYFKLPSEPRMLLFDRGGHTLMTLDFARSIDELIYQLDHGDDWGRIEAARMLGGMGANDAAAAALARTLAEPGFWGLRRECALALKRTGHGSAAATLLTLLADGDARLRDTAADALGDMPLTPELEGALIEHYHSDPSWYVRNSALNCLCKLKSSRAYDACIDALGQDSCFDMLRNTAIGRLRDMDRMEPLERIKGYAAPGNPRSYRHEAIGSYAAMAKKLKEAKDRKAAADYLLPMLADWYPNTRSTVIGALQNLGDKSAVDALRRLSVTEPVERLRRQAKDAADALANAGEPQPDYETLKQQIKALQDEVEALKSGYAELQKKLPEQPK